MKRIQIGGASLGNLLLRFVQGLIIGVGGIMTEDDAVAMLDAGADLIQVYTGFIYNGPAFVKRICKRLRFEADKRSAGEQRTDNTGE